MVFYLLIFLLALLQPPAALRLLFRLLFRKQSPENAPLPPGGRSIRKDFLYLLLCAVPLILLFSPFPAYRSFFTNLPVMLALVAVFCLVPGLGSHRGVLISLATASTLSFPAYFCLYSLKG